MSPKVWIDGRISDPRDAMVNVYDHGFLYGDGVFEGIRIYGGKIFECQAHMDRLYQSAKAIRLTIPIEPKQMCDVVEKTVAASGFKDAYVRLIVSRGVGPLGISPARCEKPSVICIVDTINMYPPDMYEKGMSVITSSVIRNHPNALSPRIKSLNYLNNILAKIEANDAGVPEAIMLNAEGNVSECTADNIFIVRSGWGVDGGHSQVQTPVTSDGILEGVTRRIVMDLCAKVGVAVAEKTLQRHDLYTADECFLTGTAAEVIPVTDVDGRVIGNGSPGPITRKLIEAFRRMIREA